MSHREKDKGSGKMILAGLGGFLLGAATILLVVWFYASQRTPPPSRLPNPVPSPTAPFPAPTPAQTPVPQPSVPPVGTATLTGDLGSRNLLLPVQGIRPEQLHDTFNESRGAGERIHEALDIMAPRSTPVLAVEGGRVVKLFTSKQGGLTIYEFDPTETYAYYYAHLDRYADGLKEGDVLQRGQVIGYVGTTGNASPDAPHLHFAIFRLTPEKEWWKGEPVNPFGLLR
jgi:murein DD-endopeptidase MepM/ murein hydrolase activator NlpD